MKQHILFFLLLLSCALPIHAAALAQLKAFIRDSATLSTTFVQEVRSKNRQEQALGTLEISRPGKFRWEYQKPYAQLIIGDGKTLWIYDKDLNQATHKSQQAALGSSPAALLAGNNTIEQNYTLKEDGQTGAIEWLSAQPIRADNAFNAIRLGFKQNQLVEMMLIDHFGNHTRIQFSAIKKNLNLTASRFHFMPPPNAEVVSAD